MNRKILFLILFYLFVNFCLFILTGGSLRAEVELHQFLKEKTADELEPTAAYNEAHIVTKCDSQSTKKFAHFKSSGDFHKAQDVHLVLGFADYCCDYTYHPNGIVASRKCDPQCVASVRKSEELQRERTGSQLINGLLGSGLSILGLKLLK